MNVTDTVMSFYNTYISGPVSDYFNHNSSLDLATTCLKVATIGAATSGFGLCGGYLGVRAVQNGFENKTENAILCAGMSAGYLVAGSLLGDTSLVATSALASVVITLAYQAKSQSLEGRVSRA